MTHISLSDLYLQQRPGQPFWDPSAPQSNFVGTLPEPLRIKPNGIQPIQAAVYEDFGNVAELSYFMFSH